MSEIIWLSELLILRIHERVIDESGGSHGVLSQALLESALNRPLQRAAYDNDADTWQFAAAYAYGIVKNHPFIDGNKRTAMLVIRAFLNGNRIAFDPNEDEAVEMAVGLASSQISEPQFADWIRHNARSVER